MASQVVSPHFDDLLKEFNAAHPGATYSISIVESSEVLNRVRQNRVSFGLCLMREPDPSLRSAPLFREFFGLYCGPFHRLFGESDIELPQLRGETSISFQAESESGPLHSVSLLRSAPKLRARNVQANDRRI